MHCLFCTKHLFVCYLFVQICELNAQFPLRGQRCRLASASKDCGPQYNNSRCLSSNISLNIKMLNILWLASSRIGCFRWMDITAYSKLPLIRIRPSFINGHKFIILLLRRSFLLPSNITISSKMTQLEKTWVLPRKPFFNSRTIKNVDFSITLLVFYPMNRRSHATDRTSFYQSEKALRWKHDWMLEAKANITRRCSGIN